MKKLFLLSVFALAACGPKTPPQPLPAPPTKVEVVEVKVPVEVRVAVPEPAKPMIMPPLPEELQRKPEQLPDLVDGTLKGIMRDGARTDSMYNDLSARYRTLVRTYDCVRGAVNEQDSSKITACLSK